MGRIDFNKLDWLQIRLLREALDLIEEAETNIVAFNSMRRKEIVENLLATIGSSYVDRKTVNFSLELTTHTKQKLKQIVIPILNRKFAELEKSININFGEIQNLNTTTNNDIRLIVLKNRSFELFNFKSRKIVSSRIKEIINHKKYFDSDSEYINYLLILLIEIIKAVKNKKLTSIKEVFQDLQFGNSELNYVKSIAQDLLGVNDLFYFNIIRNDFSFEKNYTQIPMHVRSKISEFEFKFRTFLISSIKEHQDNKPIADFFPFDFEELKKRAAEQMKSSNLEESVIEQFLSTSVYTEHQLRQIVEELEFSSYKNIIQHNSDIWGGLFDLYDFNTDFVKIKNLRNIDKHEKTKTVSKFSDDIALLYKYYKLIS